MTDIYFTSWKNAAGNHPNPSIPANKDTSFSEITAFSAQGLKMRLPMIN